MIREIKGFGGIWVIVLASFRGATLRRRRYALSIVENALAVKVSAAELPDILFPCIVVQIALSMLLVLVHIAQVNISLRVGYLHLTDQPAVDPLAFVLLAAGQHQEPSACELAYFDVFHLFEDGSPAIRSLQDLENFETI